MTRKIFVSILNTRLNRILSENNILENNNRAGVAGQSTLEPLLITQHIIEHCHIHQLPLFVMFQDLSKAYDRVNISLLELALQSVKMPKKIIKVVTNLFLNQFNSIILPDNQVSASFQIL